MVSSAAKQTVSTENSVESRGVASHTLTTQSASSQCRCREEYTIIKKWQGAKAARRFRYAAHRCRRKRVEKRYVVYDNINDGNGLELEPWIAANDVSSSAVVFGLELGSTACNASKSIGAGERLRARRQSINPRR